MSAMGFSADSARPAVLYGCAKVPISALNCAVLKCSVLLPRSHYTVLLVVGVCDNSHYQPNGENVVHLRPAICQLLQSNADDTTTVKWDRWIVEGKKVEFRVFSWIFRFGDQLLHSIGDGSSPLRYSNMGKRLSMRFNHKV